FALPLQHEIERAALLIGDEAETLPGERFRRLGPQGSRPAEQHHQRQSKGEAVFAKHVNTSRGWVARPDQRRRNDSPLPASRPSPVSQELLPAASLLLPEKDLIDGPATVCKQKTGHSSAVQRFGPDLAIAPSAGRIAGRLS